MAENELSLQQRLADTVLASIDDLQEIAEEMFTRFYAASGTAAAEREKTRVLMQEIQRLEKENGRLRTELVDTEERYWTAREEVDKLKKELDWTLGQLSSAVKDRTELSNEKTKLETQIRQMMAKEAKDGNPSAAEQRKLRRQTSPCDAGPVSLEADSSLCAREPLSAATCPRCGSMDLSVLPKNQWICCVCGEVTTNG